MVAAAPRQATRLVLDTNILVAAAFCPTGAAGTILARARTGEMQIIWNEATRRETERIVRRIPPIAKSTVLDVFTTAGEFAADTDVEAFEFIVDPDDRKFAALACAAHATLVSLDAHLLNVRALLACPVMTPGALVALIT
jgi:Predicted nucleic acid-binding protein, contains PIN domain